MTVDKILIDRAVLEQALAITTHWLELDKRNHCDLLTVSEYKLITGAVENLRAALEQPKILPSPIWRLVPTTMTNDMARVDQELRHAVPWIRWEAILAAAPNPQGAKHD